MTHAPAPADRFCYDGYEIDPGLGRLTCRYSVGQRRFTEHVTFGPEGDWGGPATRAAARLVFLLLGVSYYKTSAPPVVDLGDTATTAAERAFLRTFYLRGPGRVRLPQRPRPDRPGGRGPDGGPDPRSVYNPATTRPLIPFGGGIDSIVTVEAVRRRFPASALFIVDTWSDRFSAIERPAAVTGLPIIRAERSLDPQVLRPAGRAGLSQRPRPGHRDHLGHRRDGGRARAARHGGDVQRVVGLGRQPGHRRPGRQPPVVQEPGIREPGSARSSARRSGGPAVLLLPASPHRALGGPALRRAHRLPPVVPQLQPGLPHRPGPTAGPLVRALRQVLLHRPDPGPVPVTARAGGHLRRARAAGRRAPWRTGSAPCSATGPR